MQEYTTCFPMRVSEVRTKKLSKARLRSRLPESAKKLFKAGMAGNPLLWKKSE